MHIGVVQGFIGFGQLRNAIDDYSTAIKLDARAAWAFERRGTLYGAIGQFQEEANDSSAAVRLDPARVDAYVNCARAYEQLGVYDRALENWTKSISLKPKDAAAYSAVQKCTKNSETWSWHKATGAGR